MKQLFLFLLIISFSNRSRAQNSLQVISSIKRPQAKFFVKQSLSNPVNDNPSCMIFPKSPEFLNVLKKANCITLPFEISYNDELKKRVKFIASDSSFFGNALNGANIELINRVAVLNGGSPDDFSGVNDRESKFLPLDIIADTKNFIVVSIRKIEPYYGVILICSFTNTGKFIDGFVANYGNGNEHWNVARGTVINKIHLIKIIETGQGNQSDEDSYKFSATWKILNNGRFKCVKQNVEYGIDYTSDDDRFTKIH